MALLNLSMWINPRRHTAHCFPILVVCWLISSAIASSSDPNVLSPITLDDGKGNAADGNSTVKYRTIPSTPAKEHECSICDGRIRQFLDMAKGFAHTVAPDYPYTLIEKVADGKINEYTDDHEKAIKDNMAMVVCLVVGLLFIVIFPIVGCCVGCFRCCGKCGGSKKTGGIPEKGCERGCLMVSLFIASLFVWIGGLMLVLTNDTVTQGIQNFYDEVPKTVDNLNSFFNKTTKDINDIATVDLNFTKDVVFRDLDNIGIVLGGELRMSVKKQTKAFLDPILNSVMAMDQALVKLKQQLPEINNQLNYVKSNVTAYNKEMIEIKTKFDADTTTTNDDFETKVDDNQLTPFDGLSELNKVGNLTQKFEDSLQEIENIPEKVQNKSQKNVKDLKTSILDYTSSVTDNTDDLDFADKIKADEMNNKIKDSKNSYLEYDNTRKDIMNGVGAFVLVVASLFIIGLLMGACTEKASTPPHQRGCGSNCGRICLMVAVVLTFIFGSLLMLITTVMFIVGAPMENFVCVPLRNPSMIDKLINDYNALGKVNGNGTYFGEKLLNDANKKLTLTEILNACKNNEAIYKAFRIKDSNLFNISEILDYKSKFSVKDDISTVNVDFGSIKILTPELKQNLQSFDDSMNYNFTKYQTELQRNATTEAVAFRKKLVNNRPAAAGKAQTAYDNAITNIGGALDKEGKELQESMDVLKSKLDDLEKTLRPSAPKMSISDQLDVMKQAMAELDDNIERVGNTSFEKAVTTFTDRIFGIVDSFIDHLLYALDNNIGQCSPIWNTYKSIFIDNMCDSMIDSFNGLWFSLGWSLFFLIPSIVLAFKVSSYLTPKVLDEDLALEDYRNAAAYVSTGKNKVAPVDIHLREKEKVY